MPSAPALWSWRLSSRPTWWSALGHTSWPFSPMNASAEHSPHPGTMQTNVLLQGKCLPRFHWRWETFPRQLFWRARSAIDTSKPLYCFSFQNENILHKSLWSVSLFHQPLVVATTPADHEGIHRWQTGSATGLASQHSPGDVFKEDRVWRTLNLLGPNIPHTLHHLDFSFSPVHLNGEMWRTKSNQFKHINWFFRYINSERFVSMIWPVSCCFQTSGTGPGNLET